MVRALNRDVSYDRFVRDQIAGDLIEGEGAERVERLAALGFFACGPVYYGDAQRHDQYADRIDTLTRGFLGLTVACAPLPRPQVRPDSDDGLLCARGRVRQHGIC